MRVLIAGAGVAGLEAALALKDLASDLVEVEMLAPEPEFVYRPLAVVAPFQMGEVRSFSLQMLVEEAGASLRQAQLASVDPERKLVKTGDGDEVPYDALLLALGARPLEAVAGALTFRGPQDDDAIERMLEQARSGWIKRLVFAVPEGATWPLPLYELALLSRIHLSDAGVDVALEIVTPERAPLELFGLPAGEEIRELLQVRGINVRLGTIPGSFEDGSLQVSTGEPIRTDFVIALPRLEGPAIEGVPHDEEGFVEVDEHGLVYDLADVWAAGDLTSFSVKQGGLAAQQAEAAAQSIAAQAGANVEPQPFTPVLRGLLLTGLSPRFMRSEPTSGEFSFDTEPLWWPPAKIVGRHLAPFLATRLGLSAHDQPPEGRSGVEVAVELDRPVRRR